MWGLTLPRRAVRMRVDVIPRMIKAFIEKWQRSTWDRTGLDVLLAQAPLPTTSLPERLAWFGRLVHWVRSPGLALKVMSEAKAGRLRVNRLRYILQILEQNAELKRQVALALASLLHDTSALELFMSVGIPNQLGFIGEFVERFHLRLLPQPPPGSDLITVFAQTFCFEVDAHWIREMDQELFSEWRKLFAPSPLGVPGHTLLTDARDAAYLLSQAILTMGVSNWVRTRVEVAHFRELPFFELSEKVQKLLQAPHEKDRGEAYLEVSRTLDRGTQTVEEIYAHFRERGTSIALVYQIERLKSMIIRLRTLCRLLTAYEENPRLIQNFLASLIEQNYRVRSIRSFVNDNIVLVCHKIVETNAETGEHYISRDAYAHLKIMRSSAGGGAVTGLTTFIKLMLHHLDLAPFVSGLFASVNYALSFMGIQLLGFTLATKQPAMTATVLAEKLSAAGEDVEAYIGPFIDEIVHLLRSQIAAVFGNISMVVPTVFLIHWLFSFSGHSLMEADYARKTIASFSIFGITPFLAMWTGVLLWASSVFSGLFANWFSFRRLPEAIAHHPRLVYVLGAVRAKSLSDFLTRNIGGFASNLALGFMLGMSLPIGSFFGIGLDVRHVTLSSGMLTAACTTLGSTIFSEALFWRAVAGIASMGFLNLFVSFSLALNVAIWAKRATAPSRRVVYRALFRRLLAKPWILFFPS